MADLEAFISLSRSGLFIIHSRMILLHCVIHDWFWQLPFEG